MLSVKKVYTASFLNLDSLDLLFVFLLIVFYFKLFFCVNNSVNSCFGIVNTNK